MDSRYLMATGINIHPFNPNHCVDDTFRDPEYLSAPLPYDFRKGGWRANKMFRGVEYD
jgi:hypothetical protein